MRASLFAQAGVIGMVPLAWLLSCASSSDEPTGRSLEKAGPPSANQVPLDPAAIPKFAHQLPIPRTFAPTLISSGGQIVRHEYTVASAQTQVQMLPPGFPTTTVLAYGGRVAVRRVDPT